MSYDPCGTQRLEGDQLLRRLAEALHMSVDELIRRLHQ